MLRELDIFSLPIVFLVKRREKRKKKKNGGMLDLHLIHPDATQSQEMTYSLYSRDFFFLILDINQITVWLCSVPKMVMLPSVPGCRDPFRPSQNGSYKKQTQFFFFFFFLFFTL